MTSLTFGGASQLKSLKSKVFLGTKGSLDRLQGLSLQLSPLRLEKGPSEVSYWNNGLNTIYAEYENKKSRCMGLVRGDLLAALAKKSVPSDGDAEIVLVRICLY
jgi:hypothetical protein